MGGGIIISALVASAQVAPSAAPAAPTRIFPTGGYVTNARDGVFALDLGGQRFRLPERDRETYARLIAEAASRTLSINVRYDALAGQANSDGTVEYPLCSISVVTGASFGDEQVNCPATASPPADTSERALALGLALMLGRPGEALPLLSRAIADRALSAPLRATALQARSDANTQIAEIQPQASASFDRAWADVLADRRAVVGLRPDDPEAMREVAFALATLGGYDEALAVYRAVGRRWPDRAFQVAVDRGAVFRRQGHYAEALRALDDYAASAGPQQGMRFHYHRAWTLILLNRPAEAVEDLRIGFAGQPDYPSAFFLRACAEFKLGRPAEALADERQGLELLTGWATAGPIGIERDLADARAAIAALEGAPTPSRGSADAAICVHPWARYVQARPRSPLLDQVAGE